RVLERQQSARYRARGNSTRGSGGRLATMEETEQVLAGLAQEAKRTDLQALARAASARLPYLLAGRFNYDVVKGGFAQLLFNMKGDLLFEMQEMLVAANATFALQYYVRAIEACMANRDEYYRFLESNFLEVNPVKETLQKIS